MIFALPALFLISFPQTGEPRPLTLEQASGKGETVDLTGPSESWAWSDDGEHLVRGEGEEARLVNPLTMEESAVTEDPAEAELEARRAAITAALVEFDGVDEKQAKRWVRRFRGEADGAVLVGSADDWFVWHADGETVRLAGGEGGFELPEFSPDGSRIAFVRGNDLHVADAQTGAVRALTEGGGPELFHGKLDWVYQEEVYGRGKFKAHWWSPDSSTLAFLVLDESPVDEFTYVDHVEQDHFRVKPHISNYPKAGDGNPIVGLAIVDVESGEVQHLNLERYAAAEPLIVRVAWAPDGRLLFQVQDRIQTWLELNAADPVTAEWTTLVREDSESWVDIHGHPRWLNDGSFLWLSDRTGTKHLYHYTAEGELGRAVTSGEWAVGNIEHIEESEAGTGAGLVEFTATRDGAVDRNYYRVGLAGGEIERLTNDRGRHSISWNSARTQFIDSVSSLSMPPERRLCDASGAVVKVLSQSPGPDREATLVPTWELVEVPARDDFLLDVALLRPVPFDETQSYPVWIPTYSGPNAPSVRNSWNSSSWYTYLAQQGVIVMQVNVRSASGKGHWATSQAYKQLGVTELQDLIDAVDWVTANPWADASRVGITGYSYGGFMTAYALTHSDRFALGIAGGGVYDWGLYDTIYTERYMSTPQRNAEGYAQSSVLKAAGNLSGHLVMHHGSLDDNVHFQNLMHMAFALQKAGKPFEMMVYPETAHGVRDSDQRWHLRQLEWTAISEHLLGRSTQPLEAAWPKSEVETEGVPAGPR